LPPSAQVRLAELADRAPGLSDRLRRRALGGAMPKSVDFVICHGLSLDPVLAIEVDDPNGEPRRFLNAVLAETGAPLLRVKAQRFYRVEELRDLIARRDPRRPSTGRSDVMRLIVLAGLAAGAVAIFAPEQGSSLMRSLEHGAAWGIGREIVHNLLRYHRHW
jgi:hypothetical protein